MNQSNDYSIPFNRTLYILFLLLSLYYVFFNGDFIQAASSLGIGVIFDPFDRKITWTERPIWQRVWLLVHLGLAAACLGYGMAIS